MASTFVTFSAFLKRVYTSKAVENLLNQDRPIIGMINKTENMGGESLTVPMITRAPQGVAGASRATAQGNMTNMGGEKFVITLGEYFGSVALGDKIIRASRGNPEAFLANKKAEIDGLYDTMGNSLETYIWGNGGGSLGSIGTLSGDVITLTNPTDIYNFSIGMTCVLSANDGSLAAHTLRVGTFTVAAINVGAGTITGTAGEIAAMTGEAQGDYIFREGDFFGDTGVVVLEGLQKQLSGGATPAALYGMTSATRATDIARLAGCWVPSAMLPGLSIEQRIKRLGTLMTGRFKSKAPSHWFLHPEDFELLEYGMQTKATRDADATSASSGYTSISIVAGGKPAKIYCAAGAPKGIAWGLNMSNWFLGSLDKLMNVIEEDGVQILRGANTDEYEYRLKSYPAIWTNAPLWSGRVSLT